MHKNTAAACFFTMPHHVSLMHDFTVAMNSAALGNQ